MASDSASRSSWCLSSSSSSSSSRNGPFRQQQPQQQQQQQQRSVWTTTTTTKAEEPKWPNHAGQALTPHEIQQVASFLLQPHQGDRILNAAAAADAMEEDAVAEIPPEPPQQQAPEPLPQQQRLRFVAISWHEPSTEENFAALDDADTRRAEVIVQTPLGRTVELIVSWPLVVAADSSSSLLSSSSSSSSSSWSPTAVDLLLQVDQLHVLPSQCQPVLTPDDCTLAEQIVLSSAAVQQALLDRYGITDICTTVAADPWSVHLSRPHEVQWTTPGAGHGGGGRPRRRLVQTFLYQRVHGPNDNHYAHPIDLVPVVDLISQSVLHIDGVQQGQPPPPIPQTAVNYHRDMLHTNTYLSNQFLTGTRPPSLKPLNVVQPNGPSFEVTNGNVVHWHHWSFHVGFHYKEGLVLHHVKWQGRSVLQRASLVEMAVPYGDPRSPFTRKCAFDVGDYGLGYCVNSLELGCDCLGHIHYFDVALVDSQGQPKIVKKAICMHEEDDGLLWKHVEYRNGHSESRRSRELVISFIATVVNYEYLFYWRFKLDGTIEYEIRLSGELSTNFPSPDERTDPNGPTHGSIVAPGVNAQIHQHMFCARLDMAVDGLSNSITEVDIVPDDGSSSSPEQRQQHWDEWSNAFCLRETVLRNEQDAIRVCDSTKARSWKIYNPNKVNEITQKPVAYQLIPFTRGPSMPTLLTSNEQSTVHRKGRFATANLWVTRYNASERFPAGDYVPQATAEIMEGLPKFVQANRPIENTHLVVWHAFGLTHMPRVEDFPVMPCESTGFSLKPNGFNLGNPAIDLPPEINAASQLASASPIPTPSSCCGDEGTTTNAR